MSMLEEARSISAITLPGPKCDVRKALTRHADRADEIREIISDRTITGAVASTVFEKHGIEVSAHTIDRHRRNDCVNCRKAGLEW